MTNPNPAFITDEMWKLWTDRPNPGWKLSGIYADKPGYHNTVIANQKKWPDNYSIKLPLDLQDPKTKARAIDLTMSDSEMVKWTRNMKRSAEDPADDRLAAVREFYGTLDNKTVFGMIKNTIDGPWRRSSANLTHLWHGHTSAFTTFVNVWNMLSPILSVWAGDSLVDWKVQSMLVKKGDTGEQVKYWQYVHNAVRETVSPAAPKLVIDGNYGSSTAAAFADFVHKQGAHPEFTGESLPSWLAVRYHSALARVSNPIPDIPPALNEEQLKELVNNWLTSHIPLDGLNLTGTINGKISL
ncbi:MAG: hypothetical protein HMLIMOIP_002565 [Candidatus Nitrosomirales archaeon]|jgi:hypothetical protein